MRDDFRVAADQNMKARNIIERDFAQRYQFPGEDGEFVAPSVVGVEGVDCDAVDSRTSSNVRNGAVLVFQNCAC